MSTSGRRSICILTWLAVCLGLASAGLGKDMPETVKLNSLSQYYDGADFDHAMHLDVASDCAVCHHHTTGTAVQEGNCAKCHSGGEMLAKVACRDCHAREPFSADYLLAKKQDSQRYHQDQLGLKGAYHQSCLGCHQQMGGPTGCQDCHSRNQEGDALMRAGQFAPKKSAAKKH